MQNPAHGFKTRMFALPFVLLIVFVFLDNAKIGKACVTYNFDYDTCNGYDKSGSTNTCACAIRARDLTKLLHPGFFTAQADGRLSISKVIIGSPAETAGLREGDEIVSINGRSPLSSIPCTLEPWAGERLPDKHQVSLLVRRFGKESNIWVQLVPVSQLLDSLWLGSSLRNDVAYHVSDQDPHTSQVHRQYSFGLRVESTRKAFTVTGVLSGSPADLAGIRLGDRIRPTSINQLTEGELNNNVWLSNRVLRVSVLRGDQSYEVNLRQANILSILAKSHSNGNALPLTIAAKDRATSRIEVASNGFQK